jgi:hypothetical protein
MIIIFMSSMQLIDYLGRMLLLHAVQSLARSSRDFSPYSFGDLFPNTKMNTGNGFYNNFQNQ